jgi:fructose/tagatose bisphosphate aldolase
MIDLSEEPIEENIEISKKYFQTKYNRTKACHNRRVDS